MQAEADINQSPFIWGLVLTWGPIALFMFRVVRALLEMSTQKTSGWGAVAGGLSGVLANYALLISSQILGIVLLIRAISQTRSASRRFVAVISICGTGIVLRMCGAALWFWLRLVRMPH